MYIYIYIHTYDSNNNNNNNNDDDTNYYWYYDTGVLNVEGVFPLRAPSNLYFRSVFRK